MIKAIIFVAMLVIALIVYIDSTSNMAYLSEWGDPLKITHNRPEFFIKINTGTQAEITEACKKIGLPEGLGCPEEIFNLGGGKQEELMDFVSMIEKACGKEGKKEMLGMQPGDVRASLADITHAKEKLGYQPKTTITEGIPKFVSWYKEYYGS